LDSWEYHTEYWIPWQEVSCVGNIGIMTYIS
jgi:hypothetical protein